MPKYARIIDVAVRRKRAALLDLTRCGEPWSWRDCEETRHVRTAFGIHSLSYQTLLRADVAHYHDHDLLKPIKLTKPYFFSPDRQRPARVVCRGKFVPLEPHAIDTDNSHIQQQ